MNDFWFAFWFFLPAGIANASPVFFNKIPLINRWDTPLDFGKSLNGKRIFGDNKKWRGLIGGVLIGALGAGFIYSWQNLLPGTNHVLLGGLMGFGALIGDSLESFIKRQFGKKPGEKWFPFDQTDYIIGGLLASLILINFELKIYLFILMLYFGLHLIASYIGYLIKLKDYPI